MSSSASYKGSLLTLLTLFTMTVMAKQTVDITLDRDTLGPIQLPPLFIIDSTIDVTPIGNKRALPQWRYNRSSQTLYFAEKLPAESAIKVSFDVENQGVLKEYSLYTPQRYDTTKSRDSIAQKNFQSMQVEPKNDIDFSAEKSIGLSVGEAGDVIIDQTLDVALSGTIGDSTTIEAHITDNSTSLDGETEEVGALDRIYMTVRSTNWEATAGDLTYSSDSVGILRRYLTPKGVQAVMKGDRYRGELFGGVDGYKLAVEYFKGTSGLQGGTYFFKGNGLTPGQVIPQENSVEVVVDGVRLTEGPEEDYVVEYANGSLRFTPSFTVLDDQVIEVRYKYRDYDYTKILAGLGGYYRSRDSSFSLSTSVLVDTDTKSSSLRSFTKEEEDSLRAAGNTPLSLFTGRVIHPNDALLQSAYDRIYRLDSSTNHYDWEANVELSAHLYPLYIVTFNEDTLGEYRAYSPDERDSFVAYDSLFLDSVEVAMNESDIIDPVYLFVGFGNGTHSAYGEVALPQTEVAGEIRMTYHPTELFSMEGVGAGIYKDPNTFSAIDNSENFSGGAKGELSLITPKESQWDGAVLAKAVYGGELFKKDLMPRFTLQKEWGVYDTSARYALWSSEISSGIRDLFVLTGGAGAAYLNNDYYATRIFGAANLTAGKKSATNYHINILHVDSSGGSGRLQNLTTKFSGTQGVITVIAEEEWLTRSALVSRGYLLTEARFNLQKLHWNHRVQYKRFASGSEKHSQSEDSLHHILWEQTLGHTPNPTRTLDITTSLLSRWGKVGNSMSLLSKINTKKERLGGRAGTIVDFGLTSESNSERQWQYIFVGEGNGTHIKDTVTGIFIEKPYGAYLAKEITLWDSTGQQSVRNRFLWEWWYKTPQGEERGDGLNFLGTFTLEEDIIPHSTAPGLAWIPGVTTLNSQSKDSLSYSTLRYNQGINWRPNHRPTILVESNIGLEQRIDKTSQRNQLNGDMIYRKSWPQFRLTTGLNAFMEKRVAIGAPATIFRDAALILEQQVPLHPFWIPFLNETGGLLYRDTQTGNYGALTPGIRFTPTKAGKAEFSYTISKVNFDGEMIYPMADGFVPGVNHRFLLTLGINAGKFITFTGHLRSEKNATIKKEWKTSMSLQAVVSL